MAGEARVVPPPSACGIDGLTLYENLLDAAEQQTLLGHISEWVVAGENGRLVGKSFEVPPQEWQKTGQGRIAILFGVHGAPLLHNKGGKYLVPFTLIPHCAQSNATRSTMLQLSRCRHHCLRSWIASRRLASRRLNRAQTRVA